MVPPFPTWRLQPFRGFLRFFISPPPSSVPVLVSTTSLVSVPAPIAIPNFVFVLGFPPPFPFLFSIRPRLRHRLCPRSYPRPRSRLRSHPRPHTPFFVRRTQLPPRYNAGVQTPGFANGAIGCTQAPSSVCRDDDVCEMKAPAVNEKYVYVHVCIFHIMRSGLNHIQ